MTKDILSATIERLLAEAGVYTEAPAMRLRQARARPGASPTYAEIAADLAQQAMASGYPLERLLVDSQRLGGGNTAEMVALITARTPFILKYDSRDEKLQREGSFMRAINRDTKLPDRFRSAWPIVYAIRECPPFAYLMEYFPAEDGWRSLEDLLYPGERKGQPTKSQATRHMDAALDTLFSGYEATRVERLLPSIGEDYVARIRQRLQAAANADDRFASRALVINGEVLEPWETYLRQLGANSSHLDRINAPFSTITHGDPNPGNIMLRTDSSSIEIKLIDPKDWQRGDYLFDIAKITHFLEGTGPVEKPHTGVPVTVVYSDQGEFADIRYSLVRPDWTESLVEACLDRGGQFAADHGDVHWRARYELGMASNLLGLPDGRLKKGRPDAALALYAEGLLHLRAFCARLQPFYAGSSPMLARAAAEIVEPADIANARAHIRASAPNVTEVADHRGFQLLEWESARPNDRGKPSQLSFEHEARLLPRSDSGLEALQHALAHAITGQSAARALLPDDARFGDMTVSRFERAPGAQSVDHYWEAIDSPAALRIIPRMMSLRERIKGSDFMTWDGAGTMRPLNFELPQVALGEAGILARLEFNWIDTMETALDEFRANPGVSPTRNPLTLASALHPLSTGNYARLIEHTTFREKFTIAKAVERDKPLFYINIDHVVVQSLRTRRFASYTDIDIAPCLPVDAEVLADLNALAAAFMDRYELAPVGAPKVWRDASLLGEL